MDTFDPNLTLGAYQIGAMASFMLFGMTITQVYIYFTRFHDDRPKLKAFVAFVFLCEVGHALSIGDSLYRFTITDYGKDENPFLLRAPKTLLIAVLFSGIIGPSVQSFFSHRIYILSQSLLLPCIIWSIAFLRFLSSTVVGITGLMMSSMESYVEQWGWLVTTTWGISVANDVVITGTLAFLLYRRRGDMNRTVALLDKLIKWTVETGMLTSSTGIIMLIFFVRMKNSLIWLAMFTIGARLFANSLLASLNSRIGIREMARSSVIIPNSVLVVRRSTDRPTVFKFRELSRLLKIIVRLRGSTFRSTESEGIYLLA
ncbi:hypothetical protein GGX14DRAFT_694365, partial [Mycena pura]